MGGESIYEFVIDTDAYAGNFEREMCAYVTGCVGDCDVGIGIAERVRDEIEQSDFFDEIDDLVCRLPDDNGCHRPVSTGPTPGFVNDGYGNCYTQEQWGDRKEEGFPAYQSVEIHLADDPTKELLEFFMTRAHAFAAKPDEDCGEFSIIGFRLVRRYEVRDVVWSRQGDPVNDD